MNIGKLASAAKRMVDKRGGTEALKKDAQELKDIAKGQGSLSDKAKAAAGALKDPGARGGAAPDAGQQSPTPPPPAPPAQ